MSPMTLLQWGRTLSSAEVDTDIENAVQGCVLQWGRTLSSAEVRPIGSKSNRYVSASMGPHSFKCGSFVCPGAARHREHRFNGAALFQVRKCADMESRTFRWGALQWGRTLSSAEVY